MSVTGRALGALEIGATAFWTGASAGFAFVEAPLAFHTIPDRDVFADLTGRTLARLARCSFVAGGIATGAASLRGLIESDGRSNDLVRAALGGSAIVAIAYHERQIVPQMTAVQRTLGTFNDVPDDNPHRLAYRALHKRSTRVFGLALLLGVAQLGLAATRR